MTVENIAPVLNPPVEKVEHGVHSLQSRSGLTSGAGESLMAARTKMTAPRFEYVLGAGADAASGSGLAAVRRADGAPDPTSRPDPAQDHRISHSPNGHA